MLKAAGGIGLGAANALVEAGARVVVFADINEKGAAAAAEESIKSAKHPDYQARICSLDVADEKAVNEAFAKVAEEFGRIDFLVNSAGLSNCVLYRLSYVGV